MKVSVHFQNSASNKEFPLIFFLKAFLNYHFTAFFLIRQYFQKIRAFLNGILSCCFYVLFVKFCVFLPLY